jgi:hypothetical protein
MIFQHEEIASKASEMTVDDNEEELESVSKTAAGNRGGVCSRAIGSSAALAGLREVRMGPQEEIVKPPDRS